MSFTWTDNYVRAYYAESAAVPIQFVDQGDEGHPGEYLLINEYPATSSKGFYLNLDGGRMGAESCSRLL